MKTIKPPKRIYGLLDEDGVVWAGMYGYCATRKEAVEQIKKIGGDLGKLTIVEYELKERRKL